jgi:hypothetical protein
MQMTLMITISILAGLSIAGAAWLAGDIAVFVYHSFASRTKKSKPSEAQDAAEQEN